MERRISFNVQTYNDAVVVQINGPAGESGIKKRYGLNLLNPF
jgi:hypothetical protein